MWQNKPVIPLTITYDANGDAITPAPPPQTVNRGSWSRLSSEIMIWDDQHVFLGWSRFDDAALPDYVPGDVGYFLTDTTLYGVWRREYRITGGAGSAWLRGGKKPLRITANGALRYFSSVAVDGKTLSAAHYEASEGSTRIDLAPTWLQKQKRGEHRIRVRYVDGETDEVPFYVTELTDTGERGGALPWLLTALVSAALLAAAAMRRRRE